MLFRSLQEKYHKTPSEAQNQELDPGMFADEETPMRIRHGSRKGKEVAEPEAPGWAKRLEAAIKKTFCLTNDVNQR